MKAIKIQLVGIASVLLGNMFMPSILGIMLGVAGLVVAIWACFEKFEE